MGKETHHTKKCRVLVAGSRPWKRGGIPRVIANVTSREASCSEVQPWIYCSSPDKSDLRRHSYQGVPVKVFPCQGHFPYFPYGMYRELVKVKNNFDVVHIHGVASIETLIVALATHGKPIVVNPYYHLEASKRWLELFKKPYDWIAIRWLLHRADRIICISKIEAYTLRQKFGRELAGKIVLIPTGVDSQTIQQASPYTDDPCLLLLYAGRLERFKNIHLIVDAMPYLPRGFKLRIIGQGPYREHILEQIQLQFPQAPEAEIWAKELELKEKEAQADFEQVGVFFLNGKIREGRAAVTDFLQTYPDDPQALELKQELDTVQKLNKIRLNGVSHSAMLELYFMDEVVIGRLDDGAHPDIAFDDRRISRHHATLRWAGGRVEISDNGSTGGTYVDGQKITSVELKDRSIVNLAKIKEFKVLETVDEQNKTAGILLIGKNGNYGIVHKKLSFGFKNSAIDNTKASYSVYYQDKQMLLVWKDGFAVLAPGKSIQAGEDRLTVEEL